MREQDFSRKMVIVVREDLPSWQVLNTVAHCAAYLGNKMKEAFDSGESFITQDGMAYPRNSQYAIVAVAAKASQLPELVARVRESGLLHLPYIREMIETTDDAELERLLAVKPNQTLEFLGVGIFGDKEAVGVLTKKFSLWK